MAPSLEGGSSSPPLPIPRKQHPPRRDRHSRECASHRFNEHCLRNGEIESLRGYGWNVKNPSCPTLVQHQPSRMEAPAQVLRRSSKRSKFCITISVAVVVAVLVAIVVPVAVTLSQRRQPRDLSTTVLVPLYLYPDPGAWEPLFDACVQSPSMRCETDKPQYRGAFRAEFHSHHQPRKWPG
jgi:hypothetical protein